ncbi:type I polyketide synthase [Rhizobium sophoriradicis]|uniref:type I polyketide synthase n=1 Tax=Rhizobium sophoriradicis TaxID=1535245 RepID=UPI00098E9537|nr:type I polyketide synthase [Rhizobium sophoriradicis]RSB86879.1 type I polyketide synthase [Rhizobium sophoriradicis]
MNVREAIAICSLSCRYPDANTPDELWTNVMEGRRSFRSIPAERLSLSAYSPDTVGQSDSITPVLAGLLSNWHFPRDAFLISKGTFENTDLTHWLALHLASEAINSLGGTARLNRARTAVVVANTLTGEFSRTALLRLRQPFLDELLNDALSTVRTNPTEASQVRSEFSKLLKSRFPEPNEDSLAGGLANTIAGRIANYFDLKGGAFTVDGACSSSLLAIANAADLLRSHAVDAVITGAVDLSLDPFELVGFSRNGALSPTRMRVFDARSDGFWPGEGGAFGVLMRLEDARRVEAPVLSVIRGWGMSTDGAGGLTRPDSNGQLLAYRRAHEMANTDPRDLAYVEAHGTGTQIGDPTEVKALASLREGAGEPLAIGSIKANIGHTKAAAGFAGLVKAVLSLKHGILPPHIGCEVPHPVFRETDNRLFPIRQAGAYKDGRQPLAAVSSFGFGGINLHAVLEPAESRRAPPAFATPKMRGEQGAELFLFRAADVGSLRNQLAAQRAVSPKLSLAALGDAAAMLASNLERGTVRLGFVARDADQLCKRLDQALEHLAVTEIALDQISHLFFGSKREAAPIGYLFSGQSAPVRKPSSVWLERFPFLRPLAEALSIEIEPGAVDTAVAQPAITYANLATLTVLDRLGVTAVAATGHSLGELAALSWAGALDQIEALKLARQRGTIMARYGRAGGSMLRLGDDASGCERLAAGLDCTVACINGHRETVMAGSGAAIAELAKRAERAGIDLQLLRVSHAFHSPDMAPAEESFCAVLGNIAFDVPSRSVISSIDGGLIGAATPIAAQLLKQLTEPVRFVDALDEMGRRSEIVIEVGPGSALTRLATAHGLRALTVDSQTDDLSSMLEVLAGAFAAGHELNYDELFVERGIRHEGGEPIVLLSNPCGIQPKPKEVANAAPNPPVEVGDLIDLVQISETSLTERVLSPEELLETTLRVVSEETGLPVPAISSNARFQSDLHLNSLAVTRIVVTVCRQLGLAAMSSPTDFAEATPAILASQLAELSEFECDNNSSPRVTGIRRWAAPYRVNWYAHKQPKRGGRRISWISETEFTQSIATPEHGLLVNLAENFGVDESVNLITLLQRVARWGLKHIAIVHDRLPISALFRSIFQEAVFETILVIDRNGQDAGDCRIGQIMGHCFPGFSEYRLGAAGEIEWPSFERLHFDNNKGTAGMPSAVDTILAVGCHRGIGAECALTLAASGAKLIFAGRSEPSDAGVIQTLKMARERHIEATYQRCDVTDHSDVLRLSRHLEAAALAPSVVVFAPAINEPMRFSSLSDDIVRATLSPKVTGLSTLLDRFGKKLNRLISFGSIIGRIGLEGEGHYALANALQSQIVESFARSHLSCRCVSFEWTVWSGAGMGERLGTVERLEAKGVDALPFDLALSTFEQHVASGSSGVIAITGRFGPPPGLEIGRASRQPLRFVDRILVDFPGTELVTETELNLGRDPYLNDHRLEGHPVLPGVMGLEAMAQVVAALAGNGFTQRISEVIFHRPIIVTRGRLAIRIAALRAEDTQVEAAVFTEEDDFQAPYFTACFKNAPLPAGLEALNADPNAAGTDTVSADPLYGSLLFQGERFRRVAKLLRCTSRVVEADLAKIAVVNWFGVFEPSTLILLDPGAADAALHVLQATIPYRRLVPVSIADVVLTTREVTGCRLVGRENWSAGNTYSFDVKLLDLHGNLVASWLDARFKAIGSLDVIPVLPSAPMLCSAHLERLAREELGDDAIRLSLISNARISRSERRLRAIEALGLSCNVIHRADGRPELESGEGFVNLSHCEDMSVAIYGMRPVACDLAAVDECYPDLDGQRLSAAEWAEAEVRRKLGEPRPFKLAGDRSTSSSISSARVITSSALQSVGMAIALGGSRPMYGGDPKHTQTHAEVTE